MIKSGLTFGGMIVYSDDAMPPDRIDLIRVNGNGEPERRTVIHNLAVPETMTRPLQIGEWPWDEKGNSR